MAESKRVFILGAGFSKPAGMPLATELLPLLSAKIGPSEMRDWLDGLAERLAWLSACDGQQGAFWMNIEQVFHYAHFDIEAHRLKQHLAPVGRGDGPGTPWNHAESIDAWLSQLEEALRDAILERDDAADLAPVTRWAEQLNEQDVVMTFNYDTLAERALAACGRPWNHGTGRAGDNGVPVFKLHGSIDWVVAHRVDQLSECDLLFDKENANRTRGNTEHIEDDCRLWRCRTRDQLRRWIGGRYLQWVPKDASARTVGIAGLGAFKELHQIPGLGCVWARGMTKLYEADVAVVIGFSMSDFDVMAQIQFAEVTRERKNEGRPLRVMVIDPFVDPGTKQRFRRVFSYVEFKERPHEEFDWSTAT